MGVFLTLTPGQAIAVKYSPSVFAVGLAETIGLIDIPVLLAVIFGLIAGAMWRASRMVSNHAGGEEIGRDLLSSLLAGAANFIATLLIIEWLNSSQLQALGIAMLVGATGVRAVQVLQEALIEKLKNGE